MKHHLVYLNQQELALIYLRVKLNGHCLKQDQATLLYAGIVNIYTVYEITDNFNVSSYPALGNCLFGAVKLTKNTDIDKYE